MIEPKHFKKTIEDEVKRNISGKKKIYLIETLRQKLTDYPSNPTNINLDNVKAVDETAFQRAILNKGETSLKSQSGKKYKVNWFDGELPVIFGKLARRKCVDLIGKTDSRMIICELKFMKKTAKSSSYSPMYALLQLLIYYYFIKTNCKELDKQEIHHKNTKGKFKWENFISQTPLLIVVANKKYWDYWIEGKRREKDKQNCFDLIKHLKSELKLTNNLLLFKTPDEDFHCHKGKYKPQLKSGMSKQWVEIS
ncbi:MAG TPA: hypothetical protein VMX17_16240 [Candidatus Glassbacteria bacterium]|nr:hypothetical protein [Candidatus Glassbacteria bacterium]